MSGKPLCKLAVLWVGSKSADRWNRGAGQKIMLGRFREPLAACLQNCILIKRLPSRRWAVPLRRCFFTLSAFSLGYIELAALVDGIGNGLYDLHILQPFLKAGLR
jgi:hypothetical protein